ncbi:uncharacterized protein FA14DRAFT_22204 [Meira miltonrushii]|uniref:Cleavage/polyadenylation specificity factor A subunit C-terminal domain-containing protein n=1 Tax=Meira miltonrushii TaxID=1280837 RepID=A0A316VKF2_9BASI|nr:uncharacterized protein FA14DRAFT_22204 [Meira miltonrushii]PWN38026.1 hypothetical protein FA14DRAFT_22204 [Meira miltonrushii]
MVLSAYHSQPLPPSGVAYAVSLQLTPFDSAIASSSNSHRGKLLSHIVTARDDVVDVYEVRSRSAAGSSSNGTIDEVKLYHLRSHQIFGLVTGLGRCKTDSGAVDDVAQQTIDGERDTLIISFKDAKMALMQWSDAAADLITISIHTYERAPQVSEGVSPHFLQCLQVDPESRCAALLLPQDALAILPFYNDTAEELDELLARAGGDVGGSISLEKSLPYAPSFVLSLSSADIDIKNVRDFVFLPSFQRPTIAVLFEKDATWTGRLDERHDTCAVRFITLDLGVSIESSHRVISSKDGLPFDSLYLTACPPSVGGGVYITTSSALIHMDQGGRTVGVAVNGWHALTSKLSLPRWKSDAHKVTSNGQVNGITNGLTGDIEKTLMQLDLANSHIVFPDSSSPLAFLFLQDGEVWLLQNSLEGRTLSSINLESRGATTQPSVATAVSAGQFVFVGSMVGDSQLLRRITTASTVASTAITNDSTKSDDDDMDLDDDLYGESSAPTNGINGNGVGGGQKHTTFELQSVATVEHLGPILHIGQAVIGDSDDFEHGGGMAQTVICSGAKHSGGLNMLEPQIVPRGKRQVALNATTGLWVLRTSEETGETLLLASNAADSELAIVDSKGIMQSTTKIKGRTIFACSVPNATAEQGAIRVTERAVQMMDDKGVEKRLVDLKKGKPADVDIFKAELCASYLTILWTDGSLNLLEITASDLKPVGLPEEVSGRKFIAASVVEDIFESFTWFKKGTNAKKEEKPNGKKASATRSRQEEEDDEIDFGEDGDDEDVHFSSKSTMHSRSLWLILTSNEACLQVYSMQNFQRVWQSNSLYPAPLRLDYVSGTYEEEEVPSLELSQVQVCPIGDVLHLVVSFQNGLVNVYEANSFSGDDEDTVKALQTVQEDALALSFIKVIAKQLDIAGSGVLSAPNGESVEGISLIPFDNLAGRKGVFVGGVAPAWLLRENTGSTNLYMSAESSMDHLDVLTGDRFVYVQYGIVNFARLPFLSYTLPVPYQKKARTGRTYTKTAPHPFTKTIVAASVVGQQFVLFDPEDGHVVEDPANDPTIAKAPRSSLELFVDGDGEPVDGYEFQQCEVVSCVELVTLRSVGSVSGLKDYIAVGTIISHGEDRPARGATYIFDIVEVVAPQHDPAARFKLRLMVKDENKGPITAISDTNGYLIVVMGLKLFVRALEKDEWMITVAFLDTPFQATGLERLKNFLLLTDVHKSVWFIAFQEEPYRLVVISKDYSEIYQSHGSFLIQEDQMTIVTAAKDGVLRLYDYASNISASQGGQRLLVRSEFGGCSETSGRMVVPGSSSEDGGISKSNEIILSSMNGSIQRIQPVEEEIFNTLHLLQGQLIRTVQHFAGLNPRGFRVVRNDTVSRPLNKGILDARLLASFEMLSRPKMEEIAKLIPDLVDGADQLLRYIATLRSNWGEL